jgi:hypothetical protein
LNSSRVKGSCPLSAVHLLGGLAEPRAAQLRQLELQVFNLLIALAKLHILSLRSGVMLEDEALKSRYVIRQSVDIEHALIIPAASDRCAAFRLFLQAFSIFSRRDQIIDSTSSCALYTARVGCTRSGSSGAGALLFGRRQSIPSSNIESCAALIDTVPLCA